VAEQQSPFILLFYQPPARNTPGLFAFFITPAQRIYGFSIELGGLTTAWRRPNILLHSLKYIRILQEKVALLSILPADIPKAPVHEKGKEPFPTLVFVGEFFQGKMVKAKLMDQERREPMAKGKELR